MEKVELKLDPMTGRSRGFAFIVYEEAESVAQVWLLSSFKVSCQVIRKT